MPLSYRSAGVDIDAGNRAVALIREHVRSTQRPEVLADVGAFGALFRLAGFAQPVLVSSVDGVGTKLKIACALGKHDTIGVDLVHHCINDILTAGAEPLFFLDYFAAGRLVPEQVEQVVKGLAAACREQGCALVGGETAEMPGLYRKGDYDLVGFVVGAVEQGRLIDGSGIAAGDAVVALPSSGLHTNGYSLARRAFGVATGERSPEEDKRALERYYPELGCTLGEELLRPHRCYLSDLREHLGRIKGLAHITGGGLPDNVPRILPPGLAAHIRQGSWEVPPIFTLIQERGQVEEAEMFRTFNMGVGMVAVCAQEEAQSLLAAVPGSWLAGEVVAKEGAGLILESP